MREYGSASRPSAYKRNGRTAKRTVTVGNVRMKAQVRPAQVPQRGKAVRRYKETGLSPKLRAEKRQKEMAEMKYCIVFGAVLFMILLIVIPRVVLSGQASILADRLERQKTVYNEIQIENNVLKTQYDRKVSYTMTCHKAAEMGMSETKKTEFIYPKEF